VQARRGKEVRPGGPYRTGGHASPCSERSAVGDVRVGLAAAPGWAVATAAGRAAGKEPPTMNEISVDRRPGSNPRPNSLPRPAAWAIAAFVVTGSVCAPVARAQDAAADPFAPAREAITREIREEMVRCRLPGFAIAVA